MSEGFSELDVVTDERRRVRVRGDPIVLALLYATLVAVSWPHRSSRPDPAQAVAAQTELPTDLSRSFAPGPTSGPACVLSSDALVHLHLSRHNFTSLGPPTISTV